MKRNILFSYKEKKLTTHSWAHVLAKVLEGKAVEEAEVQMNQHIRRFNPLIQKKRRSIKKKTIWLIKIWNG